MCSYLIAIAPARHCVILDTPSNSTGADWNIQQPSFMFDSVSLCSRDRWPFRTRRNEHNRKSFVFASQRFRFPTFRIWSAVRTSSLAFSMRLLFSCGLCGFTVQYS